MSKLVGGNMMIKAYFARSMYMLLYKMHPMALHGSAKLVLETVSRTIAHRTETALTRKPVFNTSPFRYWRKK